ncbi:MAG: 2-succinyl-6-hydroxy-2,4-cyclohexadiene-1-carboxylate synthase [Anaerolineae bacterium]|nr:2-succinyl-6-hydroxy-2,4-cyclohexadiene-1-carboxylate synthase [Anaerolineae bacterium]
MCKATWPYHSLGDPRKPTLLFLHGFMGSGLDWLPIAKYFKNDYFCIMPDLPGHGNNLNFEMNQVLDYSTLTEGLLVLLETNHFDQVSLIGYSMGGRLALYFAIHYAEKIKHLILESANPGIDDLQARSQRAQVDLQRSKLIEDGGIESFVDQWYQMEIFGSMQRQDKLFKAMKTARKENKSLWMAKFIRELSPGLQPTLWNQLSDLSMVTMLIAGALDEKYVRIVSKTAEKISQVTVRVIPNVGHSTHFEAPRDFCTIVANFLSEPFQE